MLTMTATITQIYCTAYRYLHKDGYKALKDVNGVRENPHPRCECGHFIKTAHFQAAEMVVCNALMTFPFTTTSTDLRISCADNTQRDFPVTGTHFLVLNSKGEATLN